MFCSLQALRDKEFSVFDETMKQARYGGHSRSLNKVFSFTRRVIHCCCTCVLFCRGAEVEELCRGSLEAVSSLYPALRNLQSLRELESVKPLFSR